MDTGLSPRLLHGEVPTLQRPVCLLNYRIQRVRARCCRYRVALSAFFFIANEVALTASGREFPSIPPTLPGLHISLGPRDWQAYSEHRCDVRAIWLVPPARHMTIDLNIFGGTGPIVFILGLTPIMESPRLHAAGPAVVRVEHWPARFVLPGHASLDNYWFSLL